MDIVDLKDGTPEFDKLARKTCPDCGSHDFIDGPRGGLAQNIECMNCSARFNVTFYNGVLVFAQRIPKGSPWNLQWLSKPN